MNTEFGGLFVRSGSLRMVLFLTIAHLYQTGFKTERKDPQLVLTLSTVGRLFRLDVNWLWRQHACCLRPPKTLWTQRKTHVVEVSETGAPWLRQCSPFDILYKKQTVSAGRVHKHSKWKSVETTARQLPCSKRWRKMECSNIFMMTEEKKLI